MKYFILFVEKADAYVRWNHSRFARFLSSFFAWLVAGVIVKNYFDGTIESLQLSTPNVGLWILLFLGMLIIIFVFVIDVSKIIKFFILKYRERHSQTYIDLSLQRYVNRKVRMSIMFQSSHPREFKEYSGKVLEIGEIDQRGKITLRVDGVLNHPHGMKYQLHVELILID